MRKTGDTMTGALTIRPLKAHNALFVKGGITNSSSIVFVRNANDTTVFRARGRWAVQAGPRPEDPFIATLDNDVTTKKYVDELIAAELTAPARFEWKVYVNADGTPLQGSANLNGASMSDTSVIRLHKHALNAPVPIKGHGSGLTMYKHSPSPKLYYSTILSAWSKSGAEWQWKGTAEIDEIKLFSDYIQIKLGYRKESNMNFSNTGYYRFTVGGLF